MIQIFGLTDNTIPQKKFTNSLHLGTFLIYSLLYFSLCLEYGIYLICIRLKYKLSLANAVIFKKQEICKNNTHNRGALL